MGSVHMQPAICTRHADLDFWPKAQLVLGTPQETPQKHWPGHATDLFRRGQHFIESIDLLENWNLEHADNLAITMASSRLTAVLASLLPLALCTIAFAFAITATISPEWAVRHNYNTSEEQDWSSATLIRTETRSPFIVCGLTTNDDGEAQVACTNYMGSGNSSCESWNQTGSNSVANYGDQRLCQQIDWTGNLAIASTTFIGIGFLLTLSMSLIATLALISPAVIRADENPTEEGEEQSSTDKTNATVAIRQRQRPQPHRRHKYLSPTAPYVNALLVMTLIIGAILYALAQFYGVLAFVQSAPDNAAFAFYGGGNPALPPPGNAQPHAPWIQGKALSVYGSVAWFAAVLTALCAAWVWRLPTGRQSPL